MEKGPGLAHFLKYVTTRPGSYKVSVKLFSFIIDGHYLQNSPQFMRKLWVKFIICCSIKLKA